jgi:hypothetical protein
MIGTFYDWNGHESFSLSCEFWVGTNDFNTKKNFLVRSNPRIFVLRLISTQENYPWIGTDKKMFLCLLSSGLELMTLIQREMFLSVPING